MPRTSPITFMTSETPARSRRLSMMARFTSSRLAKPRARLTPPTSGEITIRWLLPTLLRMSGTISGAE